MDKLLISVLGNRDSGKSHTWNTLFDATVRTGKEERRLYFNKCEYVNVFLVSGSPEERETYVGDIVTVQDPKIVLCSAQYREDVTETFKHFVENGYFIFTHWLNPGYSDYDTPYFDYLGIYNWLSSQQSIIGIRSGKISAEYRVREIKEYIYGWANSRNLIMDDCVE